MKDIDRNLRASLAAEAAAFRPRDASSAEGSFLTRRTRRRVVRAGLAAVSLAAAATAVVAVVQPELVGDRAPRPAEPVVPTPHDSPDAVESPSAAVPSVVYSAGGDIHLSYEDGSVAQLTETDVAEMHPVFTRNVFEPTAEAIVFERGRSGDGTELVFMDLSTMEEQVIIGDAAWATFWPEGTGAWLDRRDTPASIAVGPLFSEPIFSFEPPGTGTSKGHSAGPIAWDQNNEMLFYAVHEGQGPQIYVADVLTEDGSPVDAFPPERLDVVNLEEGSDLVAPALSFSRDLDVLRLSEPSPSPGDGSYAGLELGTIEILDSGATYVPLVDLSDLDLDRMPARMTLTQAGELDAEVQEDGTVRWTRGDVPSWLVGDHDSLFLVRADGTTEELPFEVGVGASVSFRYLPKG